MVVVVGGGVPVVYGLTCSLCSSCPDGRFCAQENQEQNMRVILLLCLLTLGRAKPYQPFNITDFLKNNEIMMADSDDEDDEDDDDDDYDDHENCPAGCHCSPKVLQCSDQGESTQRARSVHASGPPCSRKKEMMCYSRSGIGYHGHDLLQAWAVI